MQKILALDDVPEKDQYVIWIMKAVNVNIGGKERIKVFDYGDGAGEGDVKLKERYDNFISNLGSLIHTNTHLKFMDNVDPSVYKGSFMYHSGTFEEVLFKVRTDEEQSDDLTTFASGNKTARVTIILVPHPNFSASLLSSQVPTLPLSLRSGSPLPPSPVLSKDSNEDDLVNGRKRDTSTPVVVVWNE